MNTVFNEFVINEFVKQYPEYAGDKYFIDCIESMTYGGGYELFIYAANKVDYYCSYWCKVLDDTTYQFEKQVDVDIMKVRVRTDFVEDIQIYYKTVSQNFNNCDEADDAVVEQFKKENDAWIRKEIAKRILNGEIPIEYSCADTDGWEVPLSQIEKLYEV